MQLKINNQIQHIDLNSCETLRDVIEVILINEAPADSIVHRVVLNGKELTEEQEINLGIIALEGVETLEVFTSTAQEISYESIKLACGQLAEVVEETQKTADCFRYQDEAEANKRFVLLIEIFQKFVHLLELVKRSLNLDFSKITTDDKSLDELQNNMTDVLSQILTTQQNKDWISLADLLEFELVPLLNTWSKIIPTLACPSDGKPN